MNGKIVSAKFALVTGAAGGIGQILTTKLIAAGYHVFMLDINDKGLAACSVKFGAGVTTVRCDITDPASVVSAGQQVAELTSKLDVLVNNAGFIVPGPFADAKPDAIEKQMQINLMGPLRITSQFLPLLAAPGSIVNIVSMAGILPLKDSAVYTAGKFGLRGLTVTLALELKDRGIRVSGIYPSSVDTPMLQNEAKSGGSPLNFIADPLSPDLVADFAMRAIREGKMEYYVPYSDGVLSRISAALPWLLPKILPMFEKKGHIGKARYLEKLRRLENGS